MASVGRGGKEVVRRRRHGARVAARIEGARGIDIDASQHIMSAIGEDKG